MSLLTWAKNLLWGDTRELYIVRSGDTLSGIAAKYPKDVTWKKIYNANRDQLEDPDEIYPGQVLVIPRDLK